MMSTIPSRHDEQADEGHFDLRTDADDDAAKGKMRFPPDKLFGREDEIKKLLDIFSAATEQQPSNNSNKEHHQARLVFVEGFSGCGKSSLIHGFVQSLERQSIPHLFTKGKYNELASVEPFSAIKQAMSRLVHDLGCADDGQMLYSVRAELRLSSSISDQDTVKLLSILPGLSPILPCPCPSTASSSSCIAESKGKQKLKRNDIKTISVIFADFVRILCRGLGRPWILCLDDLQWADPASIELLTPLLSSLRLENFLCIGGYRSNMVDSEHPLQKHIHSFESSLQERFVKMALSNLSLEDVTAFVAETIASDHNRVGQLAEAIYSRTLGNIFFCREALEELARQNAIYYDVMTFQWEFNLAGTDLNLLLSKSVVELIQSKVRSLSSTIHEVLVMAAYIHSTICVPILLECLHLYGNDISKSHLESMLNQAAAEGLLLKSARSNNYKFSHDKVQEASYTSVSRGERHRIQATVASVLFKRIAQTSIASVLSYRTEQPEKEQHEDEWIIFVAAEYFRSIPKCMVKEDKLQLAKLFLRVAEISSRKGSFEKASRYLHAGVDFLRLKENIWKNHYDFCITLFNELILIEFARGDMDGTKAAIDEVLWNGKSLKDTCTANHTKVEWTVKTNSRNFEMGAAESMRLLATYGQRIPAKPSRIDLMVEHSRMIIALRGRKISTMADLPIAEDDSLMKLLFQLCNLLSVALKHRLNTFVTMRAIRLSLEIGITKYMSEILMTYTIPLRISGKLNLSYSYATIVSSIYERFPEDRGAEYAMAQLMLYAGILPLKNHFSGGIDASYESYTLALSEGDVDTALLAAVLLPMYYHASSFPLSTMLEARLKDFENKSKLYHQPSHTALFQCFRQFQYNLVHPSDYPTRLSGTVMDEDEVLSHLEGNTKSMTLRDFSIFRMMLAVIFDDEETMKEMFVRLEQYPYFDLPVVRQHLRLLFPGLAALVLGRRLRKREYTRKGLKMMKEFQKLDRIGSENAHPVVKCFQAILSNKKKHYDDAIAACSSIKLTHLEALMNEHCGLMLREKGHDQDLAEHYLGKAMWLYHDWGAFAKVVSMKDRFDFLVYIPRKAKTDVTSLSAVFQYQASQSVLSWSVRSSDDPFQLRHRISR